MEQERRGAGRTSRALAWTFLLLSLPLFALWLVPAWQTLRPWLTIATMALPLLTVTVPGAALFALLALLMRRHGADVVIALLTAVAVAVLALGGWTYLRPVSGGAADIVVAVVHARDAADAVHTEHLVNADDVDVLLVVDTAPDLRAAFTSGPLATTLPHVREDGTSLVMTATPTTVNDDGGPLSLTLTTNDLTWTLVVADLPTPAASVDRWTSGAHAVVDAAVKHRGSSVVAVGDFGNSRFASPITTLRNVGFEDARAQSGTPWLPSWPIDGMVRPLLAFDQAWVDGALTATDVRRVANSNDDHLGMVVSLQRR